MISGLGKIISTAAQRAKPILTNGNVTVNASEKFSLRNPHILEVVPEKDILELTLLEGKKLSTVCRVLDNPNFAKIINRYKALVTRAQTGFNQQEINQLTKKACLRGKHSLNSNLDAMVYLNELDGKIAQHFDAHGIAKGSLREQLEQLNKLLSKGIDKTRPFYTAPLDMPNELRRGVGAALGTTSGCAYRDGSFIIVSGKGKSLLNDGIENVIVNDAYYDIMDDLITKFPNINFIKAENAAKYFNKL